MLAAGLAALSAPAHAALLALHEPGEAGAAMLTPRAARCARQAAVLAAAAVREQLAEARLAIEAAAELAGGCGGDSALVIDGKALAHALGPDMRQSLLAVRRHCNGLSLCMSRSASRSATTQCC
jgi:hypothetical protein